MNSDNQWVVYLVRCADDSLYCGITNNLERRLAAHNRGKGAKYTKSRIPVVLAGSSFKMTKSDALKLEHCIKRTPTNRKRFELESGEAYLKMENTHLLLEIRNELQAIVKSIQQLSDSVGNIVSAIEKRSPADVSMVNKVNRAPVRKKVLIKHGKVEQIKRVPATKIVYDIIQNSAQGIDTAALMKATGFNQRKIHNITFRLKKQGRIRSGLRGLYKKT